MELTVTAVDDCAASTLGCDRVRDLSLCVTTAYDRGSAGDMRPGMTTTMFDRYGGFATMRKVVSAYLTGGQGAA